MNTNQKHITIRFIIMFAIIAIAFFLVMGQIIYLQTVERDDWIELSEKKQNPVLRPWEATRGNIYDCNGHLLSGSLPKYDFTMDMRVPNLHLKQDSIFRANVDEIAREFARILGQRSTSEWHTYLTREFAVRSGECVIAKGVSYTQMKQIYEIPLFKKYGQSQSGLICKLRYERVKPYNSLASRSLGNIFGNNGEPINGLELRFDRFLRGTNGWKQNMKINGQFQSVPVEEPINGLDLVTTLDVTLQDIAESTLRERLQISQSDWGCCILMEVATGEIKAIVNLDRTSEGAYEERKNHAVTRVEPGSTFKTISLMAALDDGKISITDTFATQKTPWYYYDSKHTDAHKMDTVLDMRAALAASSNIVFAKMVTQAYEKKSQRFVDKLEKLHIADSIPCEIPGAQRPVIRPFNDATTISKMAYGYSVEMTPWQILMFYNAIANNGKMITPYLVKQVQRDGEVVHSYSPKVLTHSICSRSVLHDVQNALHDVVWTPLGTAAAKPWSKKAQSDRVHIAGKTGTAQLFMNRHYSSEHHRITFVGYFPEEEPRYSCICMMENPKKGDGYSYDAGIDCGSVVRIIAEKTMAYAMVPMWENPDHEAWESMRRDLRDVHVEIASTDIVPNVIGMGAKDAVYAIEQTGMRASIQGKGKVVSQSLRPGTTVIRNGTIYLVLK